MTLKQILQKPVRLARCQVTGHRVKPDELRSFFKQQDLTEMNVLCSRCGTPLNIRKLPSHKTRKYVVRERYSSRS